MRYRIRYSYISHMGRKRMQNQDNLVCDGELLMPGDRMQTERSGLLRIRKAAVMGVFDGLGSGEYGAVAAYMAACRASRLRDAPCGHAELRRFCREANREICEYAGRVGAQDMGATCAVLTFSRKAVCACSIGDSRIYRWSCGLLEQISRDDLLPAYYGERPALSQNLGIPPEEYVIEPHLTELQPKFGDTYLTCTDGLTALLNITELSCIIENNPFDALVPALLRAALERGSSDDITILLCRVEAANAKERTESDGVLPGKHLARLGDRDEAGGGK